MHNSSRVISNHRSSSLARATHTRTSSIPNNNPSISSSSSNQTIRPMPTLRPPTRLCPSCLVRLSSSSSSSSSRVDRIKEACRPRMASRTSNRSSSSRCSRRTCRISWRSLPSIGSEGAWVGKSVWFNHIPFATIQFRGGGGYVLTSVLKKRVFAPCESTRLERSGIAE